MLLKMIYIRALFAFCKKLKTLEKRCLAHFIVIWQIKDDKLYRGFQMSHYHNV
jgi:hypothetical protein